IVLATCHGAGGRQMINIQFDVLVIDEATQAVEAVCWIPIFKAKKLILAGDPMQLPPTVIAIDKSKGKTKPTTKTQTSSSTKTKKKKADAGREATPVSLGPDASKVGDAAGDGIDEIEIDKGLQETPPVVKPTKTLKSSSPELKPPPSLEVTLFDRLESMYGPQLKRMLTVQYRMHEIICQFPSTVLYSSRLESHSSVAHHLLSELPGVANDTDMADVTSTPVVFFDTAGCEYFERVEDEGGGGDEGSRRNENEAMVVKGWVEKLVEAGVQPSQIALITPYQAQVTTLTSLLRTSMPELEIGTVDGMQGREKEAIVLSLVRSNDKREVGFLKEQRRLN
ncbi:hypothetical protein FRB99_004007, partial [Tulasnella sp. 403]